MRALHLDFPQLAAMSVADKLELASMLVSAVNADDLKGIAAKLDESADYLRDNEKEAENKRQGGKK